MLSNPVESINSFKSSITLLLVIWVDSETFMVSELLSVL